MLFVGFVCLCGPESGFVYLCGGCVWIVLSICVGFVGGGRVRIVLSIFVEVLGSTRSLVVFFCCVGLLCVRWWCGPDFVFDGVCALISFCCGGPLCVELET